MAYKERDIEKLYYSIGEVADMFQVNASQIRFYENEFDVLQPKKNAKGNRLFRLEDIENLKIIFNLNVFHHLTTDVVVSNTSFTYMARIRIFEPAGSTTSYTTFH